MLKKINQLLKLVGFNLVHAKKPKRAGYRSHIPIEDAKTDARCTPSPTCCQDEYNAGKTHYVGDDCTGGHRQTAVEIKASQPASDNNVTGPTS